MEEDPTLLILNEVADAKDMDILELPPLGKTLDPQALDRMVASAENVTLRFQYAGYLVSVETGNDRPVSVERLPP